MSKVFLTCLFIFFLTLPLLAQEADTAWVRRYNSPGNSDDYALALAVDDSGDVYVTGESGTIKYNCDGNLLWIGPWGGGDIAIDDSGYIYVAGEREGDYITIKYYPNGDVAWLRTYDGPGDGPDSASAIAVDDSGNVYVTGKSYGSGPWWEGNDYATIKYFPNGDTAWIRRYNGSLDLCDEASDIAVDDSGNIYVTGAVNRDLKFSDSEDYGTIKYDPDGNEAWVSIYGDSNFAEWAVALAVDDSGYVYVTGSCNKATGDRDFATIKYNSNGDTVWLRRCNLYFDDYAGALAVDDAGNIYVTGYSAYSSYMSWVTYYTTIKYYSNGNQAWVKAYKKPEGSYARAYDIAVDDFGNVYVTGRSDRDSNYYDDLDYATIKYDSSGNQLWVSRYNGPGDGLDVAFAIALDNSGNVYMTGYSDRDTGDYLTNYDYATIKYSTLIFRRGDANSDTKVTVSDVVYLVNYLFKGGPPPNPIASGDANCDGKVTVSDVVYLVNYLFKGGPKPIC